jgi:hypothetical protein
MVLSPAVRLVANALSQEYWRRARSRYSGDETTNDPYRRIASEPS